MDKDEPILLTPTDFGVGVQEVVLVKKFGGEPEVADMPDSARRDLYRITQETMPERELRFSVDVSVPGLKARIVCRRLYHGEGKIFRLVYLTKDAPDPKKVGPKPQDEVAVLVALWAARRAFSPEPRGGGIQHYTFDPVKKNPIIGSYYYPVVYDDGRASSIIQDRLIAVRDALGLDVANLPECDDIERHSQKNDPYHKCRFYCRARTYCSQAKSIVHPDTHSLKTNGILLDDPGE
jgi:hypothetical protein